MQSWRDDVIFPTLDAVRRVRRTPLLYYVTRRPHVVEITVDGFFVPDDVASRLSDLYRNYVTWWRTVPERRWFPRHGIGLSDFENQDFVHLVVLSDHAEWWITLFNEAAALTYNPWDRGLQSA